ncbi:hypothetical protein M422DRAFT_127665, partial [Sphaerobolus stellatus SS14]
KITDVSKNLVAGGGFSDIWLGKLDGESVAIKRLRSFSVAAKSKIKPKLFQRVWREYMIWSSLSHPNILPFLGYSNIFSESQNASCEVPALISPWMSNGTLLQYLEENLKPNPDKLLMLVEIANGIKYLHSNNIVHGDIRAGNILVSEDGTPYITDFGLSRLLKESGLGLTTSSNAAGSLRWMAPELLRGSLTKVNKESDVWAFGMTILEVISGEHPFSEIKIDAAVFGQLINGTLPRKPSELTEPVWKICHDCWMLDPACR